ncbi:MAG TPA: HNH endonuclease [Bryobacteraceae bacterium]|nr:HNH endonuclease [Bryobacteraceae bacterium]
MAEEHAIISRAQAKALGLKRYFTGVVCIAGHFSERDVSSHSCISCRKISQRKRWREDTQFRAKKERWRLANLVKVRDTGRRSQERNREKVRERSNKWKENNRDRSKEITREWKAANPDAGLEWHRKNRDKSRSAANRYYQKNKPAAIERATLSGRKRRAQKKGSGGTHTAADLAAILKRQNYKCAECGADLRKVGRHLDHIVPLALGGSNDKGNLQYLCPPHNLSKGAKHPLVYAREQGRLL